MLTALIIAALAAAIAGGAASKVDVFADISKFWRKQFKKHIEDEEELAEINAFWDQVEAEFEAFQSSVFEGVASLGDIHHNYDSTLEDYVARVDEVAVGVKAHQDQIMELGHELMERLGPEIYGQISAEQHEDAEKRQAKKEKKAAKQDEKAAKQDAKAAKQDEKAANE